MSAPKERALTSVLALRASTPVAKAELLEAMWGDNVPASGVKSLQVVVSNRDAPSVAVTS